MRMTSRPAAVPPLTAIGTLLLAGVITLSILVGCADDEISTPIDAIVVPTDFPTPQAAVDSAQAGELVLVRPGTYFGSEVRALSTGDSVRASLFMKEGVLVLGEGSTGQVVLRDTTGEPGVIGVVMDSVSYKTVVQNLVFDDYDTGALIVALDGELIGDRFNRGHVGVHVRLAGQPYLIGNLVEDADSVGMLNERCDGAYGANLIRGCEVGMVADGPGTPVYDSNVMCRNRVGFIARQSSTPLMRGNAMRSNSSLGARFESGAVPDFTENDLYWNGDADLSVGGYQPHLSTPIEAAGNYWGGEFSVQEIGLSRILDGTDDPDRGATVDYVPISPVFFFDPSVDLNAACAASSAAEVAAISRALAGLSERLRFAAR
jgi:hypothetical protein